MDTWEVDFDLDAAGIQSGSVNQGDLVHLVCVSGVPCDLTKPITKTRGAHLAWDGVVADWPSGAPEPPPGEDILPKWRVTAGSQDGYEMADTTVDLTSTGLPIETTSGSVGGTYEATITDGANDILQNATDGGMRPDKDYIQLAYTYGWSRWEGVTIPAAATCTAANVQCTATYRDRSGSAGLPIQIWVQDDHVATPPTGSYSVQNLPRVQSGGTDLAVGWSPPDWIEGDAGPDQLTPDLCPLIQQRLDAAGWVDGVSNIALITSGDITATRRECATVEDARTAQVLTVDWTMGGGAPGETLVAAIVTTTVPQGDMVSVFEIIFTPDEQYSANFDLDIALMLPPFAALSAASGDISGRTSLTAEVTCTALAAWTQDKPLALTEGQCPGLRALMQTVVSDADFNGDVGIVMSGTGARGIRAYEHGDVNKVIGINATTQAVNPPLLGVDGTRQCFVGVVCELLVTATDADDGACSLLEADNSELPAGNDATLSASGTPCVWSWRWVSLAPDAGSDYQVTFTATSATGATSVVPSVLTVVNTTAGTVEIPVSFSECDAEEDLATGDVYLTSSDLEIDWDAEIERHNVIGVCFDNVPVDGVSVIKHAYLKFHPKEDDTSVVGVDIWCDLSADAAPFQSTTTNDITGRTQTSKMIHWDIGAWTADGIPDATEQSPDIRSLIQEITALPNWGAGNSIACVVQRSVAGSQLRRQAWSWDQEGISLAPSLIMEYASPTSGSATIGSDEDTAEEVDGSVETENPTTGIGVRQP